MPTLTLSTETAFAITDIVNALGAIYFCIAVIGIIVLALVRWSDTFPMVRNFITKFALQFAFAIALIAMLGSLTYSNVIGFPPCDLCWIQRIFIYPQVFMLALALARKESSILAYTRILSIVGLAVSVWHNFIYYGGSSPFPCSATASCTAHYVEVLSGIATIPSMALVSFILLFVISFYKTNSAK